MYGAGRGLLQHQQQAAAHAAQMLLPATLVAQQLAQGAEHLQQLQAHGHAHLLGMGHIAGH